MCDRDTINNQRPHEKYFIYISTSLIIGPLIFYFCFRHGKIRKQYSLSLKTPNYILISIFFFFWFIVGGRLMCVLRRKKRDGIDGCFVSFVCAFFVVVVLFYPHNIMCALTTSISTEFRYC